MAVQDTHQGFPRRALLAAPKGNIRTTTSGAAPTCPPERVFRRILHKKYGRAVGTHYGPTRIHRADYPAPSEGRQRWHHDTLSSPQLQPASLGQEPTQYVTTTPVSHSHIRAQRDQATSTAGGPTGTRAVSGLWERRAGARTSRRHWLRTLRSRWPQVDRRQSRRFSGRSRRRRTWWS